MTHRIFLPCVSLVRNKGNTEKNRPITNFTNGRIYFCSRFFQKLERAIRDFSIFISVLPCPGSVVFWTKNPSYWIQRIQKGSKFYSNCEFSQERWEKDGVKRSKIVFRVIDKFPEIFHKADIATSQPAGNSQQQPGNSSGGSFEDDIPF